MTAKEPKRSIAPWMFAIVCVLCFTYIVVHNPEVLAFIGFAIALLTLLLLIGG